MHNKKIKIMLTALLLCLSLGGCTGMSSGGSLTRQGMEAIQNLDYDTALADFTQAVKDGEDTVMACRGLGLAYMGKADYTNAVSAFDQALAATDDKMPDTIKDILLYKASAQFRQKDYEGTIQSCDTLLEEEEQSADAFYLRGASYLCENSQDKAKADFDQAVTLTPRDYELYLNIYQSYFAQNLSAVGDEYLQTALGIKPSSTEDYYNVAYIYYYLEDYSSAQTALIDPVDDNYGPALYLMSRIYLAQEDYDHAKAMYETIREQEGDSPQVCNGLALCSIAAQDYDGAIAYIEQGLAMEEETGKQELRFNEIVAYEKKLDFAAAKTKAQAYMDLYPTDEAGARELEFLSTRQ